MERLWICLAVIGGVALFVFLTALVCFFLVFYSGKRKVLKEDEYAFPEGDIYFPYREAMKDWVHMARTMPHEDVSITSFDGLTLRGRYYECQPGAIVELLFHGYRGDGERDLSGGIERCFKLGRNALIVDQRASGRSDGHVITFGVREHRDCISWIDYAVSRFGKDVKIVLTGVSMGAATVMMAAGRPLPANVVCVLADCGYTSPKEIICKVIGDIKMPAWLLYPFIRLGARWFGGFDLEETSPTAALRRTNIPVILIHGDTDDFVPCKMSQVLYEECVSRKKFVQIHGAGHGIAYPVAPELYLQSLADFQKECGF